MGLGVLISNKTCNLYNITRFYWTKFRKSIKNKAKRINGKRAYQYARNNEEIVLKPNSVIIHSLELKAIDKDTLRFNCHCSKGTYIRSLARDIGLFLDSGGHLISLKRIKSGNFSLEMAKSIDEWIDIIKAS